MLRIWKTMHPLRNLVLYILGPESSRPGKGKLTRVACEEFFCPEGDSRRDMQQIQGAHSEGCGMFFAEFVSHLQHIWPH